MAEDLIRFILNISTCNPQVTVYDNATGRMIMAGDATSVLHGLEESWTVNATNTNDTQTELEIWVDTTYDPVMWAEE